MRPEMLERPLRTVLLHGLGGSPAIWDAFARMAGPRLDVWRATLPWQFTGDGEWCHVPGPTRWVRRALDEVRDGRDVVVAHSYAANLLMELLEQPDAPQPAACVLVSPFYRRTTAEFDWDTIVAYLDGFIDILDEGLEVSAKAGLLPAEIRGLMAARMRECIGPYGWMRFFEAYLRTPFLDPSRLTMPVLVIGGDRDRAARPLDARRLTAALPRGTLAVLTGCGHFPMLEQAEQFAAAVHGFLDTAVTLDRPTVATSCWS